MRSSRLLSALCVAALAITGVAVVHQPTVAQAAAVVVEDGYSLTPVVTGLSQPHAIRVAPDGRLFLLEQSGRVRIVQSGTTTTALTLDPAALREPGGSAGLLSIAFPPGFTNAAVQHVYLIYTHEPMPGFNYPHNVLSRFVINGDTINPASEELLVHFDSLIGGDGSVKTMHYGGDMEFGADGKLYVSTGDLLIGPNAQSLSNRYGKLLRYNADGSIPTDNPYYDSVTGPLRAIWSIGLRNPFKLSYDSVTGDILIGDVGSSNWEEVNKLPANSPAVNFGWSATEGYTTDPRFRSPELAYPHNPDLAGVGEPYGCAVMGGDVYRPKTPTFPEQYSGDFFFADHCQGWLRTIDPQTGQLGPVLVRGLEQPVDMAVADNGAVWIVQRQLNGAFNGTLYRLQYTGLADTAPTISVQPEPTTVAQGSTATFEVFASGSAPLTYQWFRDDVSIPGATQSSYTLDSPQATDDGASYSAEVTNDFGSIRSDPALLTVVNDEPPSPVITKPVQEKTYAGGDTLHIRGAATDAEDGDLPRSAFTWEVTLHHNTHTHPELGPLSGVRAFDFPVPRETETDSDVYYEITLRVADSDGVVSEVSRIVMPRTVQLTLATVPSGRSLILDGVPMPTPLGFQAVEGVSRTLTAPPTTVDNVPMVLDSWENGSTAADRFFFTPRVDHIYRAFYRVDGGSIGAGTGLRADYFSDPDFTTLVRSRLDRVPYFTWGDRRPAAGVPRDNFSVRWTGQAQSQFSQAYTLSVPVANGDAVRVTVGGTTVINTFSSGETGLVSGQVSLAESQPVQMTIEFRAGAGRSGMKLQWSSAATPTSAIPGSQLFPAALP